MNLTKSSVIYTPHLCIFSSDFLIISESYQIYFSVDFLLKKLIAIFRKLNKYFNLCNEKFNIQNN